MNQQIVDWIRQQESQGYSQQQLSDSLVQQGYDPDEVNEAIEFASQPVSQPGQNAEPESVRDQSAEALSVEMVKKPAHLLPIAVVGIVVIAIVGAGIFWLNSQDQKPTPEVIHRTVDVTDELTDSEGNKVGQISTKIEADIEVASDCGGMDCFEERFVGCKPATVTSKLMDNIIYYYEILGPKDGYCEVKSKFTANPNPAWVGKEMTCKYDNKKKFETAVQDMSRCQGQLYSLMIGG